MIRIEPFQSKGKRQKRDETGLLGDGRITVFGTGESKRRCFHFKPCALLAPIPNFLSRHFALQHAHLFYARVEGDPRDITLRLEMLQGHMPQEAFPKRLLVAQPQ